MAKHSETVETSHHDPPRGIQSQRIDQARPCAVPDPRANTFLPREESDGERQHLNRSGRDYCHDVQACPRLSQSKATHRSRIRKHAQSSPKYRVTRQLEATPVRRPRVGQRTTPLSITILLPTPCNIGLPLEL